MFLHLGTRFGSVNRVGLESGRDKLVSEPRFRRFWKSLKFCLFSRMDPPKEAVDETAESVNPLDLSTSGPSESTINENASTEAVIKVSRDMARVLDRLTAPRASSDSIRKHGVEEFHGTSMEESDKVEFWLEKLERI